MLIGESPGAERKLGVPFRGEVGDFLQMLKAII